jgi:chromosome segregation ATPase
LNEKENSDDNSSSDELKEFLKREKAEIKDLQGRLEDDKRLYKQDKREAETLKHTDPSAYRQRMAVLDKVKEGIERQIDKVNQRIAKVKEIEKNK